MNCKNCGNPLNGANFCSSCGMKVEILENNNINIQNRESINSNVLNNGVNTNINNDIGFNRDSEYDLNQFGQVNNYNNQNLNGIPNNINSSNLVSFSSPSQPTKSKKTIPIIVSILGVIAILITIFWTFLGGNMSVYEDVKYNLKYPSSWSEDETKDKMTLYYKDNDSRFLLNAVTTFKELNISIDTEENRKKLYDEFYKIWSNVEGGSLTGGTDTFKLLDNDVWYARVDYKITNKEYIGAFYVVISVKYDTVISFMSYCTKEAWDTVDKDIIKMLSNIEFKGELSDDFNTNGNGRYGKFKVSSTKEYTSIGYMDYKVPDCWTYDEEKSKNTQYKSSVFRFKDGDSLLEIKGVTPYDSSTFTTGTTYEKMKSSVINVYGAIKSEKTEVINDKTWYVIVTPNYDVGGKSYHNRIYFTLSKNNTNLYYFESYIYNDSDNTKDSYIDDSIKYILKSSKLYKIDE